ncbi:hypothetical protein EIP91_011229 [Steccherinum ochraceum]|uniref:Uncharacterized protein n=1 Tax=Steccherinum ochraceum TaxID=92696 RepID=A0A4R0RMK6_9APHY|nr:hypothetical protein EIP91_011229 [Steccherinum ochraceum]
MAHGPPPSEAGPSKPSDASTRFVPVRPAPPASNSNPVPSSSISVFQLQPPSQLPQATPTHLQNAPLSQAYTSTDTLRTQSVASNSYPYYGYPQHWNTSWQAYQYNPATSGTYQYAYPQTSQPPIQPLQPRLAPPPAVPQKRNPPSPSPSPPPPPPFHNEWHRVIEEFLSSAGLTQALRGLEMDMVAMSPEWERKDVPKALKTLSEDLTKLSQASEGEESGVKLRSLDERKLSYVHFAPNIEPQTPTSVTKDISRFLAKNRARNDASNRKEFLLSLGEKRRKLEEDSGAKSPDDIASCARTDAKTQDRNIQMKYDIAKNEDGPLRKTMKAKPEATLKHSEKKKVADDSVPTAERHPALDERLGNVETHLAIRYVPSPPRSLLDRLRFIEDHIMHLEKQYPPWAALHFNQPHRGWPPPPRLTPLIVPSHLTSTTALSEAQSSETPQQDSGGSEDVKSKGRVKTSNRAKSSLHRAVMERMEVQKAMNDLAGVKTDETDGRTS